MLMVRLLSQMSDLRSLTLSQHVPGADGRGCRECGPWVSWPCEVAEIATQAQELAGASLPAPRRPRHLRLRRS
jgi:hypothetical protein